MKNFFAKIWGGLKAYWNKFSFIGLFFGFLFLALSMTPSLLARAPIFQGALAGLVFAVGYGVGCLLLWLWRYLQIPDVPEAKQKNVKNVFGVMIGFLVVFALGRYPVEQSSILELMNQPPVEDADTLLILAIAALLAVFFIWIGRSIKSGFRWLMAKIYKVVPKRAANFVGFVLGLILLIFLLNGVLFQSILNVFDVASAEVDKTTDEGAEQPTDPMKTGSSESLIAWDTLGRQGRNFIGKGPTAEEIGNFNGREAKEPIRVYAGLNSADGLNAQAKLVLEELKRVNAFDRKILIINNPTGTGWMDPYGVDTLEYLHDGDTAVAAIQYSYVQSYVTVFSDPGKSKVAAKEIFNEIYSYWTTLPEDSRPKAYLWGVSLGASSTEQATELLDIIDDPIHGTLWVGPPFASELWNKFVAERNEDSPMWLPTYKDSSKVRFNGKSNEVAMEGKEWGSLRIVYLQYGSDPMVWFSPDLLLKEPDWLKGERAPDVSPFFTWHPGVTFFQVAFDMIVSKSAAPVGFGHDFSPIHYIDVWQNLTDPEGWDAESTQRLKDHFYDRIPDNEK